MEFRRLSWGGMAGEENPRAGARGTRHARCAFWGERAAPALLACVLMDCLAPPTLRKLHPPVFWWTSFCMQPLPSLAPPVGLAGCGYRKVADAPPSLASSEALPRRPDGGYAHKGLRPEVGRGPLWRVSNPFATQPSQPRQKALPVTGQRRPTDPSLVALEYSRSETDNARVIKAGPPSLTYAYAYL